MKIATASSPDGSELLKRPWTPFTSCEPDRRDPESHIYLNSRYQVHVQRHPSHIQAGPDLVHLSFKRRDQGILVPYEDKLRIKDELVGPECEGVELLPAYSREVDMANQFHCWVIDSGIFRFPLGTRFRFLPVPSSSLDGANVFKGRWTPLHPCGEVSEDVSCNSRYQVQRQRVESQDDGPDAVLLLCQRLDGIPLIPYRDRMHIKGEVVHRECEGVELLPACSRAPALMPGCALWIIDDPTFRFPFGFSERCVTDVSLDGSVQEPWLPEERPADCLSAEALRDLMSKERKHPYA